MIPKRDILEAAERQNLFHTTVEKDYVLGWVLYDGRERLVEPYSLRYPKTGNTLLYVHEREKEGRPTGRTKSYDIGEIERVVVSDTPFVAQYRVEL